jgi:hypothetical protein
MVGVCGVRGWCAWLVCVAVQTLSILSLSCQLLLADIRLRYWAETALAPADVCIYVCKYMSNTSCPLPIMFGHAVLTSPAPTHRMDIYMAHHTIY